MLPVNYREKFERVTRHRLRSRLPMMNAGVVLDYLCSTTYSYVQRLYASSRLPVLREEAMSWMAAQYSSLCYEDASARKPFRFCILSWGQESSLIIAMVSINPQRTEEERIVFEAVGWWQASSSELFKSPALDEAASFEWPAELKQKQLPDSWYWDKLKGRTHEHWDKNQKG